MQNARTNWLSETRKFWDECMDLYDFSAPECMKLFLLACDELDSYLRARRQLQKEGLTIMAGNAGMRKHPCTEISKISYKNFVHAMTKLGIGQSEEKRRRGRPSEFTLIGG